MMSGPIVHKVSKGGKRILEDEFQDFLFTFSLFLLLLFLMFTTLMKDSWHAWRLLGANIG